MKSIRDVYKIGKGPSSSHTMGPERAARLFLSKYPDAETYRVVLYGSLSKTGRGHGTDRVLYEVLGRERTRGRLLGGDAAQPAAPEHAGLLCLPRRQALRPPCAWPPSAAATSRIEGQDTPQEQDEVYPENSFAEIARVLPLALHLRLSEYVELNEGPDIWDFLAEVWQAMKQAIARRPGRRGHAARAA